jgi:hypothetical protein
MDLLFVLAEWHALAKLRLHTDSTLSLLKTSTMLLGRTVREFVTKTSDIITKELPGETARRARTQAQAAKNKAPGQSGSAPSTAAAVQTRGKTLNLLTYKFHALGDYVASIFRFGTSDSYSTQVVCPLAVLK